MLGIYKFKWEYLYGNIESLFVADSEQIKDLIGKKVNFGCVLGEHYQRIDNIEESDLKLISEHPADISMFNRLGLTIGYNPLNYIDEEENYEFQNDY